MRNREKAKKKLLKKLDELRKLHDELQEAIQEFEHSEQQIQEKMIEYEKLSAIGRLTANVAHEIRNPITVIGGLSERLKKRVSQETKEREYLELITAESKRLEAILKDVLLFSDKAVFKREMRDVHKIIQDSLDFYEGTCKKASISVNASLEDVPQVYIDERQVRVSVDNLMSNAVEAMPDGGTLTVSTKPEYIRGKNYISVTISDTGVGIPSENLKLIYEPFFSTKTTEQETGLGLSIAKKIVEGHGGFIKLGSDIGKGTTFTLYFPYRGR